LLNLPLIVLQYVPPLCDYKVWIDTERGAEAKRHLCNMVELNMMEEFPTHRMTECKRAAYFVMKREIDRKEYKEKREKERAPKREKARHTKEAYVKGGERALMKGKWPRLTQD
jgi:hypothetical protein